MRAYHSFWGSLALLSGCTLATDAGDRSFVNRLDFEFTLTAMSPHRDSQLDVALVRPRDPEAPFASASDTVSAGQKYDLRARARVLVPNDISDSLFPDITIEMPRTIGEEPLDVLFYADTELDNQVVPLSADGVRAEHTWIRHVPPSGELSFYHEAIFQNYFDAEIQSAGADIVLDIPESAARRACLDQRLAEIMKSQLEVRLVVATNATQATVGYFKMHTSNRLPAKPILLEGIADAGNFYRIEVLVDGVLSPISSDSAPASTSGLSIPFESWFPVDAAARAACLAL